ncbi:MAG: hypothetical protein HY788_04375 [Deltaproteobacteria bacterium]|nr:hypothetical protein [Deltaproteobacteria bacterium]
MDVIFYCNEGVHAVYNWFVVTKILGLRNARVYEGSMGEWADDDLLPMVSGIGFYRTSGGILAPPVKRSYRLSRSLSGKIGSSPP